MTAEKTISEISEKAVNCGTELAARYRAVPPTALTRGPAGIHLGSGQGSSIDFHDFREYQPGDDLRRIDWAAYARNDVLSIKLYQEEVSPIIELVADTSASIAAYPGKLAGFLFTISFIANTCRNTAGRPVLIANNRKYTEQNIDHTLRNLNFTSTGIEDINCGPVRGKPVRILVSDFLCNTNMNNLLRALSRDTALLLPIMLISKSEADPAFSGACRFIDCENSKDTLELEVSPDSVRHYKERLNLHIENIEQAARYIGSNLLKITVNDDLQDMKTLGSDIASHLAANRIVEAV